MDRSDRLRFELLARRAGRLLANSADAEALNVWLDEVKTRTHRDTGERWLWERANAGSPIIAANINDLFAQEMRHKASVFNLFEISADLCLERQILAENDQHKAATTSAEANPKQLPIEAVPYLEFKLAELNELDGETLERLSEASWPEALGILQDFYPRRLDAALSAFEPAILSVDLAVIEPEITRHVDAALTAFAKGVSALRELPTEQKDEALSGMRAKLQSRKHIWMANARYRRAAGLLARIDAIKADPAQSDASIKPQSAQPSKTRSNRSRLDALKPSYREKRGSDLTLTVLTHLAGYEMDRDKPSNTEVKAWLRGMPRSAAANRTLNRIISKLETELS
jgi:hypothetical protein